jgi:hypothetical protein
MKAQLDAGIALRVFLIIGNITAYNQSHKQSKSKNLISQDGEIDRK